MPKPNLKKLQDNIKKSLFKILKYLTILQIFLIKCHLLLTIPYQILLIRGRHRDHSKHIEKGMLFRAGFGRYLAALEIIRQSPSMDFIK